MDFTQFRHEFSANLDQDPTSTTPKKRYDVHRIYITNYTGHDLKLTKETEDNVYHNPNNKSWEDDKRPPLLIKKAEVVHLYFADNHTPTATITYESPDDKNVKIEINVNGDHQYVRMVYKDAHNMDSYYAASVVYDFMQPLDLTKPSYGIPILDIGLLKVTLSKDLKFTYTEYHLDGKKIAKEDDDCKNVTIDSDGKVKFTPANGEFDLKLVKSVILTAKPRINRLFQSDGSFSEERAYVLPHNGEDIDLTFPAMFTAPGMEYSIDVDTSEAGLTQGKMTFEFYSELIKPK